VDALALEFEGRMSFGKLNVDENPMTPTRFGIQGIPTLLLFKGGRIVESVVGLVGKEELKRILEKHV
jgi:thioredoxin 1